MSTSVADLDLFSHQIRRWTADALERRPRTFGQLLRALPGVDPGLVSDELVRTAAGTAAASTRMLASRLLAEARTSRTMPTPSTVPVPHPLDCYWPNDPLTLRALTNALARRVPAGGTIAYLAWPNAFGDAQRRLRDRRHVLLEADGARANAHRAAVDVRAHVRQLDVLRDSLPPIRADAILADPPWYPAETKAFLWAAARIAAPGATVLLALPPLGTRPGIELERRDVLDWAAACGLRPRILKAAVLGYLMPPFERAALAARGVPGTPDGWRRGDLLVLEASPTALPPRCQVPVEAWQSTRIDGLPLRMRVDDPPPRTPLSDHTLLASLVDGDVLASVSRRTAVRTQTRLWTSRNRVFASADPALLAVIVDAVSVGRSPLVAAAHHVRRPLASYEQRAVGSVAARLSALVRQELREHGLA